MPRRKMVVGNWKMNGSLATNRELVAGIQATAPWGCDVVVCPPHPYLADVAALLKGSAIGLGAQDCAAQGPGALTGDVAAVMLRDFGCHFVIVGHSERRAHHGESDKQVADKAAMALSHGLTPIVCVGETLAEREAGWSQEVVQRQIAAVINILGPRLANIVVAYEPVWAIGTGKSATPEHAQAVHLVLRAELREATPAADRMRILYGGSVKPDNAAAIFSQPDIDGGLIGGAALKAAEFVAICRAAD